MKKVFYVIILLVVVVSGIAFIDLKSNNESSKKSSSNSLSIAERKTERKKWEASADGQMYKKWKESPEGLKVYASEAKIHNAIKNYNAMEAVVTSLSLPTGSRLGHGVMVKINDNDFILSFGALKSNEFQQLKSLKIGDKLIIKSKNVSHAPKYSYPIVSGDYVQRDGKIIYKSKPRKNGC